MYGKWWMNASCILAAMLVTFLPVCNFDAAGLAENNMGSTENVRTFHGAWFEIQYPVDFTAKPSLSSTTAEGYDSAEFTSSDGSVSFYVFAPQWAGEASDIDLNPERERLVDELSQPEPGRNLRWFTIEAKDGSYLRSYMETVAQQGSIKNIIGIKYYDEKARRRYQAEYLLFRQSLELYAD